jgi:hypothetical protein
MINSVATAFKENIASASLATKAKTLLAKEAVCLTASFGFSLLGLGHLAHSLPLEFLLYTGIGVGSEYLSHKILCGDTKTDLKKTALRYGIALGVSFSTWPIHAYIFHDSDHSDDEEIHQPIIAKPQALVLI